MQVYRIWTKALVDDEVLAFIQALQETIIFENAVDVTRFLETPWRYEVEFAKWRELGRPNSDSEQWDAFLAFLADWWEI